MSVKRTARLGDQIKEIVSILLQSKIKDPHLGFVTVTDVTVTGDLREATIFYSVYGDTLAKKNTNRTLQRAKGFIQSELARQLHIRKAPIISFKIDHSIEQGDKIEQLLNQIHQEDEHRQSEE